MPELAIVLPTYNEADNLRLVVDALEALNEDVQIVIVDDNSQDGTQQIAEELSETFGNITLVSRPRKLGLGSAIQTGLKAALDTDATYVMTMDADQSHDPADVPRLLELIRCGEEDIAQGSRYIDGGGVRGWPLRRRLLSRLANLLYHWFAGAPRESTTNFRIFSRKAASLVVALSKSKGYEFLPEVPLLAQAGGLTVGEVPIIFTDRKYGKSKLGTWTAIKASCYFMRTCIQYRLCIGRYRSARGFFTSGNF